MFFLRPAGRTIVARDEVPGQRVTPHTPPGRADDALLEHLLLIEFHFMDAEKCEKFCLEVPVLVMFLLTCDIGLYIIHARLADGESAVAFLPSETTARRQRLIDPFRRATLDLLKHV